MRSSASHPAGPHGRLAQKIVNPAPKPGGVRFRHNLHSSLQNCCDSSTTCRLCRLEPIAQFIHAFSSIRLAYLTQYCTTWRRMSCRDPITEVLIDLQWLTIKKGLVCKIIILTFQTFIDGTFPLYLCELIE